jgi:hypothetical protein
MAQPLTVLRGALGAWKLRSSLAGECDRYLDMSMKQVGRLGDLLSSLQDVLDTADGELSRVKVDIGELTVFVLEDMDSDLREWGVKIDAVEVDRSAQIRGDRDRTGRAIRAALRIASSVSSSGGLIRLSVGSCDGRVKVIVEQTTKHGKILSFADRLNLSLVETNIRSQGGECEFVEDPLRIRFTLTAYRPGGKDHVPATHSKRVALSL